MKRRWVFVPKTLVQLMEVVRLPSGKTAQVPYGLPGTMEEAFALRNTIERESGGDRAPGGRRRGEG